MKSKLRGYYKGEPVYWPDKKRKSIAEKLKNVYKIFSLVPHTDLREIEGKKVPLRVACLTCIYWMAGRCRRHAPLCITGGMPLRESGNSFRAVWPETMAEDLCGEWAITWRVDTSGERVEK